MDKIKLIGLGILVVLIIILWPFGFVRAGERGVQTRLGAVTGYIFNEGMYFKVPFVENVVRMNVKIQKYEVDADAASKDLQTVSSRIALNFHINPNSVATIYQTIGKRYQDQVIVPAVQESVKAATAKYTADQLITKREAVRDAIKSNLVSKLESKGILVDEINIVNFDFSKSFNDAIEAKVTAEQSALAQKNKLEQVKYEAEQKVTQAKAEAEAIKIQAEAITQQGGADYVNLKAVEKWNGVLPNQMIPNASLPFINLNK